MKLLIDMCLSPGWVPVLQRHGHDAVHWSNVGDPKAPDSALMAWAAKEKHIIITLDMGFTTLLFISNAVSPSVVQIREPLVSIEEFETSLVAALISFQNQLERGSLVSLDLSRGRAKLLPLNPPVDG